MDRVPKTVDVTFHGEPPFGCRVAGASAIEVHAEGNMTGSFSWTHID
jgi:hypothetical protein